MVDEGKMSKNDGGSEMAVDLEDNQTENMIVDENDTHPLVRLDNRVKEPQKCEY